MVLSLVCKPTPAWSSTTRNFRTAGATSAALAVVLMGTGCGTVPPAPNPDVRYIAFGDSTTNGPADKQYVDYLPQLLDATSIQFANEGMSGETSGEGLDRMRTILAEGRYPDATTLIYWEGGNDVSAFIKDNDPLLVTSPSSPDFSKEQEWNAALDEAQANVEAAIAEARTAGLAVFVVTYFPLAPGIIECDALPFDLINLIGGQSDNGSDYIAELNQRLAQAAAKNGATIANVAGIGDELTSSMSNYEDCNHLSSTGNELAAQVIASTIGQ